MPVLKRFTTILLCIIASLPMFLSAGFLGGRTVLRHAMQQKLASQELVSLEIPGTALVWMEEGKELLIEGRMFDVRSIRYAGDRCLLTGLFDDDETELYEQLVRAQEGQRHGKDQVPGLLQVCLGITAVFPPEINPGFLMEAAEGLSFGRSGQEYLISRQRSICTPPPEELSC
jgi:hypothetical protein